MTTQPPQSLFNISSKPNNLPTMQKRCNNREPCVRSPTGATTECPAVMSRTGVLFLSNDSTANRVLNTEEDVRACDTGGIRQHHGLARNQGIIDKRCKAVRGRLYEKVRRRDIQRQIDQLDTLMQKLLETQDPANEKMYDLYAKRKAQYEAVL